MTLRKQTVLWGLAALMLAASPSELAVDFDEALALARRHIADRIVRAIAMDRPLLMSPDEKLYIDPLDYQGFDLDEQLVLIKSLYASNNSHQRIASNSGRFTFRVTTRT